MKYLLLLAALLLLNLPASAQSCATDRVHRHLMTTDSAYARSYAALQNEMLLRRDAQQRLVVTGSDTTFELPVVFHIMHTGQAIGTVSNPTDAQLTALLDYVNKSFEASWPGYPTAGYGGVNTGIRFVLAQTDSKCAARQGIVRVDASAIPNYAAKGLNYPGGSNQSGANVDDLSKLSRWRPGDYINIYVVNWINDPQIGGFAYYPSSQTNAEGNRVFMNASSVRVGESLLVHELGHALNLAHTFEGDMDGSTCPPATPCNGSGDNICDTEPGKRWPDCSSSAINACTGKSWNATQFNFMNYSTCTNRFTKGQREWMRIAADGALRSVSRSMYGQAPQPAMIVSRCVPVAIQLKGNALMSGPELVSLNTLYKASGTYIGEDTMFYVDNSCVYRTELRAGATYQLTVQTRQQQDVRAYIDYNYDGAYQIPGERIIVDTGAAARSSSFHRVNITIPTSGVVRNKPLRFRVVADYYDAAAFNPCGPFKAGQAEDYAVTILDPLSAAESPQQLQVVLYPNPAQSRLQLRMPERFSGDLRIFNALGQALQTRTLRGQDAADLELDGLAPGMYQVVLHGNDGRQGNARFLKQ